MPPLALLQRINQRYERGPAPGSSALDDLGILLHSIDGFEDEDKPWQAATHGQNANAGLSDRISVSLVWKGQKYSFMDNDSGLYGGKGSYIINPDRARILCAYGGDGSTRGKTCHPSGQSRTCIPGCIPQYNGRNSVNDYDSWCNPGGATDHWCEGRPWRPQDVGKMIQRDRQATRMGVHSTQHGRTYNEVVVDGLFSNRNLPGSIEAFVASPGDDMEAVRRTHAAFLSAYHLTARDSPLLIYRTGRAFGCVVC